MEGRDEHRAREFEYRSRHIRRARPSVKRRDGGSFLDWRLLWIGIAALVWYSLITGCGAPLSAPSSTPVGLTPTSNGLPATTVGSTTTTQAAATTADGATTAEPTPTTTAPTTAPTTTEAVSTTTSAMLDDGTTSAIDALAFITVENEHVGGYVRDLFGYPADLNGDGCDTRAVVL